MINFQYRRATDVADAVRLIAGDPRAKLVAGGTNLIDLMKMDVEQPTRVIDITRLPLKQVESTPGGGLRIGALVRNTDLAYHPLVAQRFPVLASAVMAGASQQLRNMASTGGNLLQRTRCPYFYDTATPCNKRAPGSGCSAIGGQNRMHAILSASDACIATHPSDMCVALAALDAVVRLSGPRGERTVPVTDFHLLPGDHPDRESVIEPGELIVAVDIPPLAYATRSVYIKVRDRRSYAFALASAAVALDVHGGVVRAARIALGGVGTKPWRAADAERALVGRRPDPASFRAAADAALAGAVPRAFNGFKVELAKRTLVRALARAGAIA